MVCYPSCIRYFWIPSAYLFVLLCSAFGDTDQSQSSPETRSLERVERSDKAPPNASVRERIVFLKSEIARHDDLYFKQANPEIGDFEYDQLKRALQNLERSHPEIALKSGSLPGIGDDRDGLFQSFPHEAPMLSLRKAYSNSALLRFHNQVAEACGTEAITYLIEPKIDGIAISLIYQHGRLIRALTRGNGLEGDDITENMLTIASIPRELSRTSPSGKPIQVPELIELRGEVFSSFADFNEINRQREYDDEPPFAHPRSLAAGSAKLAMPSQAAQRKLSVLIFGYGSISPMSNAPKTQKEFYEIARSWGLPALPTVQTAEGFDALASAINTQNARRSQLPFPTDGLVVKVNSLARQRLLGSSERAPRWALAYKFAPEQIETRLLAISIQVGRTGLLTPVAELEPVSISGSLIIRATLHNRNAIAEKDLRIGDTVFIEKAGEIIPRITGVNLSKRPAVSFAYAFPKRCPSCASPIELDTDSPNLHCFNASCPDQLQRRIEHFASSECLDIDGLGPATIQSLIANGWVTSVSDLYKLDESKLLSLGKDLRQSTNNLLQSIERSKHSELWRLIYGLGIPGIGKTRSQKLAQAFGSIEALMAISESDFEKTDAAGSSLDPTTQTGIRAYFSNPSNQAILTDLIRIGLRSESDIERTDNIIKSLLGMRFTLTGKLPTLNRQQATELIESSGGIVQNRVTKQTDYLLLGANPGSKLEEAESRNINVIDETEFLAMQSEDSPTSNARASNPN